MDILPGGDDGQEIFTYAKHKGVEHLLNNLLLQTGRIVHEQAKIEKISTRNLFIVAKQYNSECRLIWRNCDKGLCKWYSCMLMSYSADLSACVAKGINSGNGRKDFIQFPHTIELEKYLINVMLNNANYNLFVTRLNKDG